MAILQQTFKSYVGIVTGANTSMVAFVHMLADIGKMGDFETVSANPEHIDHLVKSMLQGMRDACVVGITTDADLLSAVFTILLHLLKITKSRVTKEEYEINAKEIGRVLTDLLMEFGPTFTVN